MLETSLPLNTDTIEQVAEFVLSLLPKIRFNESEHFHALPMRHSMNALWFEW